MAEYLLKRGSNPNEKSAKNNFETPLIKASYGGHLELVKLLINYGADYTIQDKHGQQRFRQSLLVRKPRSD